MDFNNYIHSPKLRYLENHCSLPNIFSNINEHNFKIQENISPNIQHLTTLAYK